MRYFIAFGCFFLIANGLFSFGSIDLISGASAATVQSIIKRYGQPDQFIDNRDQKILLYYSRSYSKKPPITPQVGVHISGVRPVIVTPNPISGASYSEPEAVCTTLFIANKNGIITEVNKQGVCP